MRALLVAPTTLLIAFMSITTLNMRCCVGSEDVVLTVRKMDEEDERGVGCDVHLCRDDYEEDEGREW